MKRCKNFRFKLIKYSIPFRHRSNVGIQTKTHCLPEPKPNTKQTIIINNKYPVLWDILLAVWVYKMCVRRQRVGWYLFVDWMLNAWSWDDHDFGPKHTMLHSFEGSMPMVAMSKYQRFELDQHPMDLLQSNTTTNAAFKSLFGVKTFPAHHCVSSPSKWLTRNFFAFKL